MILESKSHMEKLNQRFMEVKPFIKCQDYWPTRIPEKHLAAYNAMIQDGQIRKHHVIYSKATGSTLVEYYSTVPHEWILEEMGKLVREG